MSKTQADCKKEFSTALSAFISECRRINAETPYSPTEPKWWLEMMALEHEATKTQQGL
jgi:hypothetical protein